MKSITVSRLCEIVGGTLYSQNDDFVVNACSTSSKEGDRQTVFIPIIGERTDGHNYIKDAFDNGMRVCFSSRKDHDVSGMTYIFVNDTLYALQKLAAYHRALYDICLIGITGSVGKTTTKEMIAAALESKYRVLKTAGNRNSQIGMSMMMLEMSDEYDIAVIEMGMSMPGEMERLASIARPSEAVITNIGVAHIGQLGSKKNIFKAKMNIINNCKPDAKLYICGDDEILHSLDKNNLESLDLSEDTIMALDRTDIINYGIGQDNSYYADDIRYNQDGMEFDFCYKDRNGTAKRERVSLGVLGTHNIKNAVAALTVAYNHGIEPETAKIKLEEYRPLAMRGQIEFLKDDIILIDDTYNASPDSMSSGLGVLDKIDCKGRRIAVLADVLELGNNSAEYHHEIGTTVADSMTDILVTVGEQAAYIAENAAKNSHISIKIMQDRELAKDYLLHTIRPGDAVFLKGSRGMKLDEIAAGVRESFS